MLIFTMIFLYVFKAVPPTGEPSGLKNFPLLLPLRTAPVQLLLDRDRRLDRPGAERGGLIKKVQFPHEHLVFSVVVAQFGRC
jgi:hypothetical protein